MLVILVARAVEVLTVAVVFVGFAIGIARRLGWNAK